MLFSSYIIFEGADGIGKTVLAKNMCEKYGYEFTYEPFGFDYHTGFLRNLALMKDTPKLAREYLLLANRGLGYEKVNEILSNGGKVISDRSYISGAVYAHMEGFDFKQWWKMARPLVRDHGIRVKPMYIFCKNKKYKNKDNSEDRYDSQPESFHRDVETVFRMAFNYFGVDPVEFEIDFDLQPLENLDRLCEVIDA